MAWSCALGPGGLTDYSAVVALAEDAATSGRGINRQNTLGAILYRAGRFEKAVEALDRSVATHGAGGTPYDAFFLAMAHHRLGHAEEAARWLAPRHRARPDRDAQARRERAILVDAADRAGDPPSRGLALLGTATR